MRRLVLAAAVALVLALPAGAAAWTQLGPADPTVVPSVLVTRAGTVLVSFDSPVARTISLARGGAPARVLVSGDPAAGQTQLLQLPSGELELYFPNAQGVARLSSTDDGATWTGPAQTRSLDLAGITGATVAPDGTPYFVQWHTGAVNVFRGLNGESSQNVYTPCCGYDASVAVDGTGLVQVAFYSNAGASGAFVYEALGPDLAPTGSTPLSPTVEHTPSAPLVADRLGNTFMAWAPGYPSATAFAVVPFRGGHPSGDGVTFRSAFGGGDPHMALAVDPADRLWGVWSGGGALHAARSSSHDAHFGAEVSASVPGTVYQVAAAAVGGRPGKVAVVVNTGSALVEQELEPGLSVRVWRTAKKAGRRTVVTRWAQALDDGFPVPDPTFVVGGRTLRGDVSGKAKVPAGRGAAAAPGYVGAAFRIP